MSIPYLIQLVALSCIYPLHLLTLDGACNVISLRLLIKIKQKGGEKKNHRGNKLSHNPQFSSPNPCFRHIWGGKLMFRNVNAVWWDFNFSFFSFFSHTNFFTRSLLILSQLLLHCYFCESALCSFPPPTIAAIRYAIHVMAVISHCWG